MSTPTTTELLDAIGVLYSYILTSINTNHPKSLVGNSLHDFADGNGRIPAYQHINPNGSIEGENLGPGAAFGSSQRWKEYRAKEQGQ